MTEPAPVPPDAWDDLPIVSTDQLALFLWTHPLCDPCYERAEPGRQPYRLVEDYRTDETCCQCGQATRSGIYYRADPRTMPHCTNHDDD